MSDSDALLEKVRGLCLALPEVIEKTSHGAPCFFLKGRRQLAAFDDHHHGADRVALWVFQPEGAQAALVEMNPERFFVPPYVGTRGWIGVRIDRDPDWDELAEILEDGYRALAPKKLIQLLDGDGAAGSP